MTVQPRGSRWALGATFLALLLFVGWIAVNRPPTASMADGTTFEIAYLEVAPTNIVVRGTFLGRVAERWIPANGWRFGKYEVRRPQRLTFQNQGRSDLLVAAIKLRPGSPREKNLLLPTPEQPLRFQIIGDDGFGYVEDYATFSAYADGVFAILVTPRFPRDSAMLRFRLEERHSEEPTGWREIATLTAPNPKPTTPQTWSIEPSQRIRLGDNMEIELGQLTISTSAYDPQQLWVNSAMLPIRFWVGGRVEINWGLQFGTIRDGLGNLDAATFNSFSSNGWVWHPIERPLSPQAPWRFDTHVAQFTNFPAAAVFSFPLSWPLASPIHTNMNGLQVVIDFVNTDMLRVELPDKPSGSRLSFLTATTLAGEGLDEWAGSWNQHYFWKMLRLSRPTNLQATIAIHTNYPARFTIQPTLQADPPAGPPE